MRSNAPYQTALGIWALLALIGCEFSDSIVVGRHDISGDSEGSSGLGPSGGGPSSTAGVGGGAGAPWAPDISPTASGPRSLCDLEPQSRMLWISPAASSARPVPGIGGSLVPGEYQLTHLVKYGECPCFDAPEQLAQSLSLSSDGTGFVISDYNDNGTHFASTFSFTTEGNAISFKTKCVEPPGREGERAPFGSFESFTASGHSLVLISQACSYHADYVFVPSAASR